MSTCFNKASAIVDCTRVKKHFVYFLRKRSVFRVTHKMYNCHRHVEATYWLYSTVSCCKMKEKIVDNL